MDVCTCLLYVHWLHYFRCTTRGISGTQPYIISTIGSIGIRSGGGKNSWHHAVISCIVHIPFPFGNTACCILKLYCCRCAAVILYIHNEAICPRLLQNSYIFGSSVFTTTKLFY